MTLLERKGYGSDWHGDGVTKDRNEPVPEGTADGRSIAGPSGAACSERKRRGRCGTLWNLDGVNVWVLAQVADSKVRESG